ncbi:MAG: hypothetical protein ACFFAS_11165 [Promethearchaeota archaeon]
METQSCQEIKEPTPLEKDEINWCLVILLGIFTGGIGVIIYFAIYFSKPQNKRTTFYTTQVVYKPTEKHNPYILEKTPGEESDEDIVQFCPSCGVKLERSKSKFCPFCGTSVI